jgi:hypothetical protein
MDVLYTDWQSGGKMKNTGSRSSRFATFALSLAKKVR